LLKGHCFIATIGKHYIESASAAAMQIGVDTNSLIMMAGFSPSAQSKAQSKVKPNHGQRISDIAMVRLLQSLAVATDDAFFGFATNKISVSFFELLLQSLGYCQTIEQALSTLKTGLSLAECELDISEQSNEVRLRLTHNHRDPDHFLSEYLLVFIHRVLSWLAGSILNITRAEISYRPEAYLQEFAFLFRCPVVFDCCENTLVFDRPLLDITITRQRHELAQVIAEFPMIVLRYPGEEQQLNRRVYRLIVKEFIKQGQILTAAEVAEKLAISSATLRRHLALVPSSFAQIKAEFCKEQALRLLTHTLTIEQIAYRLGYSESRAFSRAFKQWTGLTPSQYQALKTNNH